MLGLISASNSAVCIGDCNLLVLIAVITTRVMTGVYQIILPANLPVTVNFL